MKFNIEYDESDIYICRGSSCAHRFYLAISQCFSRIPGYIQVGSRPQLPCIKTIYLLTDTVPQNNMRE